MKLRPWLDSRTNKRQGQDSNPTLMGQYHLLVNLDKKQVVHPHKIGNGLKLVEQVGWEYSTSTVLFMLLASASRDGGMGGGDFRSGHALIGSWAGDRVALVGDYAEAEDIPGVDNAQDVYRAASWASHDHEPNETWDEENKSVVLAASAWKDISEGVRKMMSDEFGITYSGEGWLRITEKEAEKPVSPTCHPDLVISVPISQ